MTLIVESAEAVASLTPSQVLLVSVPSLIALVGVLASSIYNDRSTRRVEGQRAVAAMAAEDRRAQAAIDAEDRRFEHALALERQRITTASRHELYVRIESARRQVWNGALKFWRPPPKPHDWYSSGKGQREHQGFHAVLRTFAAVVDEASLYGSKAVSEACDEVYMAATSLSMDVQELLEQGTVEAINAVNERLDGLDEKCKKLLIALRAEVGSDADR